MYLEEEEEEEDKGSKDEPCSAQLTIDLGSVVDEEVDVAANEEEEEEEEDEEEEERGERLSLRCGCCCRYSTPG